MADKTYPDPLANKFLDTIFKQITEFFCDFIVLIQLPLSVNFQSLIKQSNEPEANTTQSESKLPFGNSSQHLFLTQCIDFKFF